MTFRGLAINYDIRKSKLRRLLQITMLEILCSKTLCNSLSKVFEISSEIVHILLLLSTLLILCGIIVKTTAIDLVKHNPNCLCVQVFVLVELNNNIFDLKGFRMTLRVLIRK